MAGDEPRVYDAGLGQSWNWEVDLPTGGPYMLSMNDAAGGTGGVSLVFNVLAASPASNCATNLAPSTLNFTVNGSIDQCGTISITPSSGVPPFTLIVVPEILSAPSQGRPLRYLDIRRFRWMVYDDVLKLMLSSTLFAHQDYVLDLPSNVNIFLTLQDSSGQSGVSQMFTIGSSGNTSCLTAAATVAPGAAALTSFYPLGTTSSPTAAGYTSATTGLTGSGSSSHKSSNVGVIVGPVIAVIALILIVALLFLYRNRRRHRRKVVELTPERAPAELPEMDQNLVADPYQDPVAQRSPLMAEFSNDSRVSMATKLSSPSFDPVASFNNFSSDSQKSLTDQQPPSHGQLDSYHPYETQWTEQQRQRSSSPPLPPGAAAPNPMMRMDGQMQSFRALQDTGMGGSISPLPHDGVRRGSIHASDGGGENAASSSSLSPNLQVHLKGYDEETNYHASPPPIYTERS
ncbi:hypothetical protein FRB98_005172 [Tulasnella sp. 332]|nr:hypothetical protein FRB98_005172 [Tulasnella sp. 332]